MSGIADTREIMKQFLDRLFKPAYRGWGPMPPHLKRAALDHVLPKGAPVIETGTFKGRTTRALLATGRPVHTIELADSLADAAFPALEKLGVTCWRGDSGKRIGDAMDQLIAEGCKRLGFWLDGHWSGGETGKDPDYETPILAELDAIDARLSAFDEVVIAIDDFRCFGADPTYPPKTFLVSWAEDRGLSYDILPDIFVITRHPLDGL